MATDFAGSVPFMHGHGTDLNNMDLPVLTGMKKKKKKKVTFGESPSSEDQDSNDVSSQKENEMPSHDKSEVDEDVQPKQTDFFLNKKKKKKKRIDFGEIETTKSEASNHSLWTHDEKEYTYNELLSRISNLIKENNPDIKRGELTQFTLKPPQVLRRGHTCVFVNFMEICQILHRSPKHVQAFIVTEMGSTGSLNGKNHLTIKGRYKPKHFENVLRNYVKCCMVCKTCRSFDTTLQRDSKTRLLFLHCETCASKRCIAKD